MFSFSVLISLLLFKCSLSADISKNCEDLLEAFANANSDFFSCAIRNSRPITLCESCIDSYLDVVGSYQNMTKLNENGTICVDNYINQDRLQIVSTLYSNSQSLWNRAKCYECFQRRKGTITPVPSNETLHFNAYYYRLMKCLNETQRNDSFLCSHCLDDYLQLNVYYGSISDENEKIGVCMDIVDMMNVTRRTWSKKCCEYRRHNEYIFLGCTLLVFVATIAFYVNAKIYTVKKTPTILQQRRFAESLNQADIKN